VIARSWEHPSVRARPKWTVQKNWRDALACWDDRCAYCGERVTLYPARLPVPLPVCWRHVEERRQQKASMAALSLVVEYLAMVRRGADPVGDVFWQARRRELWGER